MTRRRPSAKPCIRCEVANTVRPSGICLSCSAKENAARVACTECGKPTFRKDAAQCWDCYTYATVIAPALAGTDPSLGLGEGDWRYDPFRRAQVWVPRFPIKPGKGAGPTPPPSNKTGPKVPLVTHEQARTQPCRHCRAQPGQPCRQSNGAVYSKGTHRVRRAAAEAVLGVAA